MLRRRVPILNDKQLQGDIDAVDTKANDAAKTATTYITAIDNNGIRVHPASTQNNSAVINANGMEVFKGGTDSAHSVAFYGDTTRIGKEASSHVFIDTDSIAVRDGLTELASFGANGMKIGKNDEKHIEVTSTAFNVYDEDGSVPFAVNTGTSLKTETTGASTQLNVSGASHQTWLTQIYLKGVLTDGKIHFGTSTSGSPSTYPSYIEPTTAGETITVNGVQCYAKIISASILQVSFRNTTSSKIYAGYQISQQFYETTMKVNDAVLGVRTDDVFAVNSTGGLRQTACYARTYGKVVSLTLAIYNTATVTPYNVIYNGKLLNYLPAGQVYITGYSAGAVVGTILADGTVTVTNSTPNSITSSESSPIIVQGTYIFK